MFNVEYWDKRGREWVIDKSFTTLQEARYHLNDVKDIHPTSIFRLTKDVREEIV